MRTPQEPVGSGFGAASTTNDVMHGIDLSGKTAIVTGGYAGLGLETARTLASAGARVVVPARDLCGGCAEVAGRSNHHICDLGLFRPSRLRPGRDG